MRKPLGIAALPAGYLSDRCSISLHIWNFRKCRCKCTIWCILYMCFMWSKCSVRGVSCSLVGLLYLALMLNNATWIIQTVCKLFSCSSPPHTNTSESSSCSSNWVLSAFSLLLFLFLMLYFGPQSANWLTDTSNISILALQQTLRRVMWRVQQWDIQQSQQVKCILIDFYTKVCFLYQINSVVSWWITVSRSTRAVLLIFSACLMCRNWFWRENISDVCFCFHPSLIETSESRKCVRHEIRPGYLLSHALASRLPSNRTKPPLWEYRGSYTTHIHVDPHTRYTTYCNIHATPATLSFVLLFSSVPT